MHRLTPLDTGFRAYHGASRATVDSVQDFHLMQTMAGSLMRGEARKKIERWQNFGFSSVILPPNQSGSDAGNLAGKGAEAFMVYVGGNRSHPVAASIDDRRHRPRGLKPGESAQYDDIGQMSLLRRGFSALLSVDDDKSPPRFASLRHVQKQKQPMPQGGTTAEQLQAQQTDAENFKHEGDTVNTEVRATKNRIEFRVGDDLVGHYDKSSNTWEIYEKAGTFRIIIAGDKILCQRGDNTHSLRVDSTHVHMRKGNNAIFVDDSGCWSTSAIGVKADPT
jgi:hypothetical protein